MSDSLTGRGAARRRSWRVRGWVATAVTAWVLSCLAIFLPPLAQAQEIVPWSTVVYVLVGCALAMSALAVRYIVRPGAVGDGAWGEGLPAARAIVDAYGEDSLSPFILRPDKRFEFAAGGVTAYRLIGSTAVVSGDPVAPPGSTPEVLAQFVRSARPRGWRVAFYGASARSLEHYRSMGLRAVCVGEEAVVDPARFTLEGRAVRKLRQSVHRVARRGWEVIACDGREVSLDLEREIDSLEHVWRSGKRRLLGFAMAMGEFESGVAPRDLYLIARSPEGDLRAVMRFISHRGKLSLDTMRRIGETPNGLNEALVCRALEVARERGVREVSLNYAGLGHLVRNEPSGGLLTRTLIRVAVGILGRRFQMERLVRFNEKFSPEWRPRYLVYESRIGLPRTVLRVLQVEGYLPQRTRQRTAIDGPIPRRGLPALAPTEAPTQGRIGR